MLHQPTSDSSDFIDVDNYIFTLRWTPFIIYYDASYRRTLPQTYTLHFMGFGKKWEKVILTTGIGLLVLLWFAYWFNNASCTTWDLWSISTYPCSFITFSLSEPFLWFRIATLIVIGVGIALSPLWPIIASGLAVLLIVVAVHVFRNHSRKNRRDST